MQIGEPDIISVVVELGKTLPRFPGGRVDYHSATAAPVLSAAVRFEKKLLLLKRSSQVHYYKGRWNVVAGYLDEPVALHKKVFAELHEELGVRQEQVRQLTYVNPIIYNDTDVGVRWTIFPTLLDLREFPVLKLNEEHTEYRWVLPDEISQFSLVPPLSEMLATFL
ncbi:NUDIX pyrophosphatase [Candidatus Uhrbacteria bacterium CG10_big_fil_rev_8_21_14_0_10_48_11]|uniref:NUDIX pyrophosphatase n=1 Tax=Candidatus Uhrbacteria bacterium CG10_big_fil_rev_8_21_14_0_10_48_11 TaxID=1975037 RepID=A0A2M8LFJ2_9BACT|nr:MAG: NUDIX pyrophosphatase [Candidatus Uhrbacteria bacterium CG10_big_fil_rev_8_21_14_0_10_48_11]